MKIFAREFLWFITAIILALPVAYLFIQYMSLSPTGNQPTIQEQTFEWNYLLREGSLELFSHTSCAWLYGPSLKL